MGFDDTQASLTLPSIIVPQTRRESVSYTAVTPFKLSIDTSILKSPSITRRPIAEGDSTFDDSMSTSMNFIKIDSPTTSSETINGGLRFTKSFLAHPKTSPKYTRHPKSPRLAVSPIISMPESRNNIDTRCKSYAEHGSNSSSRSSPASRDSHGNQRSNNSDPTVPLPATHSVLLQSTKSEKKKQRSPLSLQSHRYSVLMHIAGNYKKLPILLFPYDRKSFKRAYNHNFTIPQWLLTNAHSQNPLFLQISLRSLQFCLCFLFFVFFFLNFNILFFCFGYI